MRVSGETITALLIASRDVAEQPAVITLEDIIPVLRYFRNPLVALLAAVLVLLAALLGIAGAVRAARREKRRKQIYEARRLEYMRRMSAQRRRDEMNRRR